MMRSLRFQASDPGTALRWKNNASAINNIQQQQQQQRSVLSFTKRPAFPQPLCSLTTAHPSPQHYTSTIGSSSPPHPSHWNLTYRHLTLLQAFACVIAISATWLFCSAIPALLAFKRAAESLEKLMDTTREELPNTMAAIRLSGMEISDLTTELSDIGQEITQGVRSSTRAVRLAEQRLRRLTNTVPPSYSSSASLQGMGSPKAENDPAVARTARSVREGIVKSRAVFQIFFTIARYSKFALNFITGRR